MITLKSGVLFSYIEILPCVSRLDVYRNLSPYEDRYQFMLSSEGIVFPETMCSEQWAIQRLFSPGIYEKGIPYPDIVAMKKTKRSVRLYLRTGHIFFFSRKNTLWTIVNAYNYGNPRKRSCWWKKLCGKLGYLQRVIVDELSNGQM